MKLFNILSAASLAAALPTLETRQENTLDVQINRVGNSEVHAVVRNLGNSDVKILKTGTILDDAHVEKAQIVSDGQHVPFSGIRVFMNFQNLPESAFVRIPAGGSVEKSFDVAEFHDLAKGGSFTIQADGSFPYAKENSTAIEGVISYHANHITEDIDGVKAAEVHKAYQAKRIAKRTNLSGCTGSKLTAAKAALSGCASRAKKASTAAKSGSSAKVKEYFKSTSTSTRNTVAAVYDKMATECGTTTGGSTGFSCVDTTENYCQESGATAYADVGVGITVYCEDYFTFPSSSTECHAGDQVGIAIHEYSHLTQIKGTDDYTGYGYEVVQSLTAAQNLNHADTYMLFANAIEVGC